MGEYTKTNWENNKTKLNAENMNHIEDGIEAANNTANSCADDIETIKTNTNLVFDPNTKTISLTLGGKNYSASIDVFSTATNVNNGTGTNAVQMKQDGTSGTFDFTNKNPHATEIDETLTGQVTYGAIGNFATVVGGKAQASGKRSMAQGTTTIAKGNYSHAEGDNSVAYGNDSHAEGYATTASGTASHSEGNNTIASGELSHAEGFSTQAIGQGSHAEGAHTIARGDYSHASGLNTEADYNGQTVIGHCNDNKETTVFEVGCGWTDENGNVQTRKNGFEVHLDGHAEVSFVPTDNNNAIPNIGTLIELENTLNQKIDTVKGTIPTNISNGNPGEAGTNVNIQGGKDSIADYDGDFVFGTGLRNTMENQAVFGKYNDNSNWEPNRPLLMVGNGTSDAERSNAFEVYLDGHAEVKTFGTTPNSVVRRTELVEGLTDIYEKLEGKKTTYILDCTWNLNYLKGLINSGLKVEDASGNDITELISTNQYNPTYIINGSFNSNNVTINPPGLLIVLKPTKQNFEISTPSTETYILDTASEIFEQGDTVLITQPYVPDRWYAGSFLGFYPLETRKVEVPTKASQITMDSGGTVEEAVMGLATNMFNSLWVATQSNPVSTTITSARGKSWECQYRILRNVLTDKLKVEYTLYSLTEETATAELISFNLLTTVTIGATYVTDTIAYANLPKPIEGDTYWTFDTFTFDEASDVGDQCTLLPFRGSGGFETRIFVIDSDPPASITFKKVIANVTLYQK